MSERQDDLQKYGDKLIEQMRRNTDESIAQVENSIRQQLDGVTNPRVRKFAEEFAELSIERNRQAQEALFEQSSKNIRRLTRGDQ